MLIKKKIDIKKLKTVGEITLQFTITRIKKVTFKLKIARVLFYIIAWLIKPLKAEIKFKENNK